MSDYDDNEPTFPYLAFCPISIYDPANHKPDCCPYCGPGGEMTDEDIQAMIAGDEKPLGQMTDSEWCTCGGQYKHVHMEQNDTNTEDTYQCDKCKTWCIIVWDSSGVEIERRYEAD